MITKSHTNVNASLIADSLAKALNASSALSAAAVRRRSILAFAALVAALGAFNAWGALRTFEGVMGPLMAAVVILAEYLAATLAMDAEKAWRADKRAKAIVCALIAGGVFAPLNVWGTHRAVEAAFAPALESQRQAGQAAIDRGRGELMGQLAALDRRIEATDAAIAAIPAGVYGSRIEILQRPHLRTLDRLERQRDGVQARLDQMALTAETPPLPLPDWLVWLGGVMLEIAKLLGIWAVALGIVGAYQGNAASALARQRWAKAAA